MRGLRAPTFLVLVVGSTYVKIPLAASFPIKEGDVMALSVVSLWSIVIPLLGLAVFIAALSCVASRKPSATESVPSTSTSPDNQSKPERVRVGHVNRRKPDNSENRRVSEARTISEKCWMCCTCGESSYRTDLSPAEAANIDDDEYEIVIEKLNVFKVPLSLVALPGETRIRGTTLKPATNTRSQVKVQTPVAAVNSSAVRDERTEPVPVGDVKKTSDTQRRPSSRSLGSDYSPDSKRKDWNVEDKDIVIPREVPESASAPVKVPSLSPQLRQQQYQEKPPHEVLSNYMSLAGPSHAKDATLYEDNFNADFDFYRGRDSEYNTSPVMHPRRSAMPRDTRDMSRGNSPVNEDSHQYQYGNVARVKKELSDYCRPPRMSLSGDNNAVSEENLFPACNNTITNRSTYWTSECVGNAPFVSQKQLFDTVNAKVRDAKENGVEGDFYDYENYSRRNISPSQKRSLSPSALDFVNELHQNAKRKLVKLSPRQLKPDIYGVYRTPERKHSSSSFEVDEGETVTHVSESVSKMLYERISARVRSRSNVPLTAGEVSRVGASRYDERRSASRKITGRQTMQNEFLKINPRNVAKPNEPGKLAHNERMTFDGRAVHFPVIDSSVEETLQNIVDLDVSKERSNVQCRPVFLTEPSKNEKFVEQKREWNLYHKQQFKSQQNDHTHQPLRVKIMENKKSDTHDAKLYKGQNLKTLFDPSNLIANQDSTDLFLKIQSQLQERKQKWPNSYESELVYSDEGEESAPDLSRIPSYSRHERSATLPREESRSNLSYHNQHYRSEPVMNAPIEIIHEDKAQAKKSLRPKNVFSQRRLTLNDSDTYNRFDHQGYAPNLQNRVTEQQVVNHVRPVTERTLNWTFQIKHPVMSESSADDSNASMRDYYDV